MLMKAQSSANYYYIWNRVVLQVGNQIMHLKIEYLLNTFHKVIYFQELQDQTNYYGMYGPMDKWVLLIFTIQH